jgi:hypothetical protein
MDDSEAGEGTRPRPTPYGPARVVRAAPTAATPPSGATPFWTPAAVVVLIFALGVAGVVGAGLASAFRVGETRYEAQQPIPTYVEPPVNTQPDAPEGAKPGSIAGFAAPRGGVVSDVFTLEQAIAASQQISDLSVQAAGPIDDPDIAPGTTSFPVYPVGCMNVVGGQVDAEVWFRVDDVPAAIERVRALWEANGYTLDPTSSPGRFGYVGPATGPVDVVSIENKQGVVKLRVASVCTPGTDF